MISASVVKINGTTTLKAYKEKLARRCEAATYAAAHVLAVRSSEQVPQDTEALVDSLRITQVGTGLDTKVYVGYGGKDLPPFVRMTRGGRERVRIPHNYARRVHDDFSIPHPHGGKANYLLDPVRAKGPGCKEVFNDVMKAVS